MAQATDKQNGLPDKATKVRPALARLETVTQGKQSHQNDSREQLIGELEALEQQLSAQTDELRETELQLASAEQRERDRLARILHDDLQQLLLAAKWKLRFVRKQLQANRAILQELREATQLLDRSIEVSRSLSRDLSPPALDSGLMPAVTRLVEHFREAYGFQVSLIVKGRFSQIPDSLRDFLFQAIRELLINAAKHSSRTQAELRVRGSKNVIAVAVSDEGIGFDLQDLDRILAKGSGLLGIWTRINRMGGQLRVETTPGSGATFRLSVPCAPNQ